MANKRTHHSRKNKTNKTANIKSKQVVYKKKTTNKNKKNNKINIKRIIYILLILLFSGIIIYSTIKIAFYTKDTIETKEVEEELLDYIKTDEETKEVIVDYNGLKQINSDMVAYLIINDTNISYPIVRGTNNDYYLDHNFKKNYNASGWLFADYTNKFDGTDNNIVIFGHSMKNKTMFGELSKLLKKDWYSNPDNLLIKLMIDDVTYTYKVFSMYIITAEDYYISTGIPSNEFNGFVRILKERSIVKLDTNINNPKQILTLSTCYDNYDKRLAVHAIRIENID